MHWRPSHYQRKSVITGFRGLAGYPNVASSFHPALITNSVRINTTCPSCHGDLTGADTFCTRTSSSATFASISHPLSLFSTQKKRNCYYSGLRSSCQAAHSQPAGGEKAASYEFTCQHSDTSLVAGSG